MQLEDLLVMEVPRKQLQRVCSNYKLKPKSSSSEDYAKSIVTDERTLPEGKTLVDEYQYAGKTAVRIYKPQGDGLEKFNNIQDLKSFLKNKYGQSIFNGGIRAQLSDTPQLFKAVEYKGKLYLSFVCLGSERRVFKNYEIVRERPQYVDYLVVYFNPLLLQVRVASTKDALFKAAFLDALNIKDKIDWLNMSEFSSKEADDLKVKLSGSLKGAKHKMTEGIYDTVEVRAKDDIDLSEEPEYQETYSGKPFKSLTFWFPYKYNNGIEEEISVRVSKEGVNFFSDVSEEVIEHFTNVMLAIKFETFRLAALTLDDALPK